jgi:hypothetical protein
MYGGRGVEPISASVFVKGALALEAHPPYFSPRFVQQFTISLPSRNLRESLFSISRQAARALPNRYLHLAHKKRSRPVPLIFTLSDQASRNHTRVIYNDDIVRTEISGELFKTRIGPFLLAPLQHEHS